jgi:CTP synthase
VLLPYVRTADEIKTKPAQQSVALLRGLGIQPDILMCRTEKQISGEIRRKLSLFCNVPRNGVIQELDVASVYEVPSMLHAEGADSMILDHFGLSGRICNLSPWTAIGEKIRRPKRSIPIALVGKYVELQDAYKSIQEALVHGALGHDCSLEVVRVDGDGAARGDLVALLQGCAGIIVPGGFGGRGIEGILRAITHAREHSIPFLGICLGMQLAVIEFARHGAGLAGAHSLEFDPQTPHPVIAPMDDQRRVTSLGGTMRLGAYDCQIRPGTRLHRAYGRESVRERHRHRYEFNHQYLDRLTAAGLHVSGTHGSGLVEAVELSDHPWFVGVQFHPEFRSKPHVPHPLFLEFIRAAAENHGPGH